MLHRDTLEVVKELYQSLVTESSLSASLTSTLTLSTTVSAATKRKISEKTEVSGISLIKQALIEMIYVDKCFAKDKKSTLKRGFLDYLENSPYRTFLDKYGSHVNICAVRVKVLANGARRELSIV